MKEQLCFRQLHSAFELYISNLKLNDFWEITLERFDYFGKESFSNSDQVLLTHLAQCAYMTWTQMVKHKLEFSWEFEAAVGILKEVRQ